MFEQIAKHRQNDTITDPDGTWNEHRKFDADRDFLLTSAARWTRLVRAGCERYAA